MLAQMTSAGRLEYHICDADFAGGFGCRHFLYVFFAAYFQAYCKKINMILDASAEEVCKKIGISYRRE